MESKVSFNFWIENGDKPESVRWFIRANAESLDEEAHERLSTALDVWRDTIKLYLSKIVRARLKDDYVVRN